MLGTVMRNLSLAKENCLLKAVLEADPIAYFILLDYETNINIYYRYDDKHDDSPMLKPFYYC